MAGLETLYKKILTQENINRTLALWRFQRKKVVFTNGCFDILHRGHIEYLARAAQEGDALILGLNSDASIRRIKGPKRPIQDERSRSLILASLSFISKLILFDEDTPYNLIKQVQPDVLVKGADYKPEDIVGYDIVTHKGGRVVTIDLVAGHSTSNIIAKSNSTK